VLDAATARLVGVLVAGVVGWIFGGAVAALLAASGAALCEPLVRRLRARREAMGRAAAMPDLVDLFLIAASAGQPVSASIETVAARAPPAIASAVRGANQRIRRGLPIGESLALLGADLGPEGVPLTDALRQAASAGVPLVPLLEGVAAAARDRRRRRAQEVARRLPVTMLLPLVACTLPAAIILAVVPVLLVSLSSLAP
jgi:tight adherence protein C